MLDWDDLRFFLAVARAGSLSSAASALGVTQPTVGRRITAFEKRLGARLFLHTPTGRRVSSTGQRLLEHAERIELDVIAAERVASGRDAGVSGRIVIGSSEWVAARVLAPLLEPLIRRYPGLIVELSAEARHVSLRHREADVALRPSRFEHADIVQKELARLSFGLYASDRYLAEYGSPDLASGAAGHRLIAMSEELTKVPDVEWLPQIAAKASVVARANGREPMVVMAASGVGMAVLPRFVGDAVPGLRLLSTGVTAPERKLWAGYHRDARSVPRVRATVAFLSESMRRLSGALCPR
jgi:DNA-binding transcriptional LysR family regulator